MTKTWEEAAAQERERNKIDDMLRRNREDVNKQQEKAKNKRPPAPAEIRTAAATEKLLKEMHEANGYLSTISLVCTVFLVALVLSVFGVVGLFLMTFATMVE